jgi:hypothetical protein
MVRLLIRCCIGGYSSGRNRISSKEWYNCYSLIEAENTASNEPEQSVLRRIFQKKKTYALIAWNDPESGSLLRPRARGPTGFQRPRLRVPQPCPMMGGCGTPG